MSTIFLLNLTLKSARKLSPFLRSIKKPLSQPFKKVLEVSLPSSQSVDESGTLIRKNLMNVPLFYEVNHKIKKWRMRQKRHPQKFAEIYKKFETHQVDNNQHQKQVFMFLFKFRKFLLIP